jgi:hypothetical protein
MCVYVYNTRWDEFFFHPLAPTLEHRADFLVSWSFTDGRTPWTGDQLVAWPLPKHRTTQTQKNAHIHQTSMPWVGSEPMIPASERAKIVHALDCSATVTGAWNVTSLKINSKKERLSGFEWNSCKLYRAYLSMCTSVHSLQEKCFPLWILKGILFII